MKVLESKSQMVCLAIWVCVHLIIILLFFRYDLFSSLPLVREDVVFYEGFARNIFAGLMPYRDFAVEYPPLSLLVFIIPKIVAHTEAGYRAAFFLLMMSFEGATFLLLRKIIKFLAPSGHAHGFLAITVVYLGYLFSLGHLIYFRYDIVVALTVLLALYFSISNRTILSWVFLAFAVALKGFAIFLIPIFLIYELGRTNIKRKLLAPLASFVVASFTLWLPLFVISPKGLLESFIYHGSRGIEIGSTYSSLILLMRYFGLQARTVYGHQSIEVISPYSPVFSALSPVLMILIMSYIYIKSYHVFVSKSYGQDYNQKLVQYTTLTILVFILTFKVFSPQYLIWFIPLVPLLGLNEHGIVRHKWVGFFLAAGLTQFIVFRFFELVGFSNTLLVIQFMRNFLLWSLLVSMLIQYTKPGSIQSAFSNV